MNKQVLLLIVFLALNLSTYAQGQGREGKKGNQKEAMQTMVSTLELDELQEISFKEVLRQTMTERRTLRDHDLTQEVKRETLKSISDKENIEVAKILNDDQYNEFLLLKDEMREKARKQRNGGNKKRN